MRDSRTYSIFPSNLSLPKALHEVDLKICGLGYSEAIGVCDKIQYTATIDSTRTLSAAYWKEFLCIIDCHPNSQDLYIHSHWTASERKEVEIFLTVSRRKIDSTVGSTDEAVAALMHETIRLAFHASNPAPEKSPELSRWNLKKTIFLARRFDGLGMRTGSIVRTFLSRAGFSVSDGEGYEARMIPEKVKDRIMAQDILVALVTPGDLTWIMSEVAFAHAQGRYVVFLVQEGCNINKGIAGSDYEHITFPKDRVEAAFSDLLFALPN